MSYKILGLQVYTLTQLSETEIYMSQKYLHKYHRLVFTEILKKKISEKIDVCKFLYIAFRELLEIDRLLYITIINNLDIKQLSKYNIEMTDITQYEPLYEIMPTIDKIRANRLTVVTDLWNEYMNVCGKTNFSKLKNMKESFDDIFNRDYDVRPQENLIVLLNEEDRFIGSVHVSNKMGVCFMIGIRSATFNLMLRNCDTKGQKNIAVKILHGVKIWCIKNGLTQIFVFQPIGKMPEILESLGFKQSKDGAYYTIEIDNLKYHNDVSVDFRCLV